MPKLTGDRRSGVATGTAAGLLAFGAAVAFAATAAAQPPPPEDPAPPPPGPTAPILGQPLTNGFGVLGQTDAPPVGPLGLPEVSGLDRGTLLGQNAVPMAPGAGPGTPPNLNVFNNGYGLPQNDVPSAPGQGSQFDVPAGQENADVSKREWLGRYIDLYRDGRLKGGLLGQMPQEQLGEPLPGTAPPPGTNIPPGLGLPDPDAPPVPPAP
jgi:hypothetical protein